jgi:thiol-disulfide isomerase/thioredoxin
VSDPVEVVVYGAPDCSLCDDAKLILEPAAERLGFRLTAVDISLDPELEARYRTSIPVVEIDGERAFSYHVLPSILERRIEAAQARRGNTAS